MQSFVGQLFKESASRDSPDKAVSKVFGGIASASANVSATRSIDWEFVVLEIEDNEHEIHYKEIRTYRTDDPRTLSLYNWKDWLESAWEDSNAHLTLLASEIPADDTLELTLAHHSDGIWYQVEKQPYDLQAHINVLAYLPVTLPKEEKRKRIQRARTIFEDNISLQ